MLAMLHEIRSRILFEIFFSLISYSGFIIAAFVFNDSLDMGVKGVLTTVSNVNNSLIEIQSKVLEATTVRLSIYGYSPKKIL